MYMPPFPLIDRAREMMGGSRLESLTHAFIGDICCTDGGVSECLTHSLGPSRKPFRGSHTALQREMDGWLDGWRGRQRQNKSNDTLRKERSNNEVEPRCGRGWGENAKENGERRDIDSRETFIFDV